MCECFEIKNVSLFQICHILALLAYNRSKIWSERSGDLCCMKVVTWNVNNRVGTVSQQVQELRQREPDVVALQDVNYKAVSHYSDAFRRIGLPHVLHTLERQSQAVPTGVLLASRFPLSLLPDLPDGALWSQGCYTHDREKLRPHCARPT